MEIPEGSQIQVSDSNTELTNALNREWKPHKRQEDFLAIPDTVYEALYGGAAYGGKSMLVTLLPIIRGFHRYQGFKGIILRRKFPDLEREIIRVSKEYYPHTGAKYNDTKHSWEWPWGAYMDFGHCQHARDIMQYDGYQANYCSFDELTHFEESMYQYMVGSRVRPGSASINVAIVRNATNPGGVGQTFCFNRFVKPNELGYRLIVDKKTGLRRIYIPCLPQDNPYGMKYDPDYLNKLEILTEADKRAKKFGDWHAFEGSVFPEFRPIRFSDEPENALHVIPWFEIPEWWPRIVAIDWGKRAMCIALWAALSPDGRVYIYRERTWKGIDVPFWAAEVGDLSSRENLVDCMMCGSAWQDRGVETIAHQFERYSNIRPSSSENNKGERLSGLHLIHDFLRWGPKPKRTIDTEYNEALADEIFRHYGAEARIKYLSQFMPEADETNLPRLQILCKRGTDVPVAPTLVETIPVCMYDDRNIEDIAEFEGDDPIDDLRYLLKAVNRYLTGLPEELVRREKVENAYRELRSGNDQTKFYRTMEVIESDNSEVFGVRRHSTRRH